MLIQRFLWWCAGAHVAILKEYPTEWGKYAGIGGTIMFTALMASFAGGYAFYTAFQNIALATAFGIFWGSLIFNLDRYIVSSIGKGDGTSKITLDEWKNAAPRIFLAFLIGFVVAVPLELKVFEKEITVEIQEMINEKRQQMIAGLNDFRTEQQRLRDRIAELKGQEQLLAEAMKGHDPRIELSRDKISNLTEREKSVQQKLYKNRSRQNQLNTDIVTLESQTYKDNSVAIQNKRKQLDNLEKEAVKIKLEIDQIQNQKSAENSGIQQVQTSLGENYNALIEQNNNAIENINKQIEDMDTLYQKKIRHYNNISIQYNGFMARMEALSRLSYEVDTLYEYKTNISTIYQTKTDTSLFSPSQDTVLPQKTIANIDKQKTVVWYVKWMLTLLFLAIEIAPILFKMMTESGPYDDRVEEIRYKSEVDKKMFISKLNQKINTELNIAQQINAQKLQAELLANKQILDTIATAQAEIITAAIEKWKEREIDHANLSPDDFIKRSFIG